MPPRSATARKVAERQIVPASQGARARRVVREWYTAGLALAGWALVTSGIAALTSPVAWRFSAGLTLLLLVGLKPLRWVIVEGLDRWTRTGDDA